MCFTFSVGAAMAFAAGGSVGRPVHSILPGSNAPGVVSTAGVEERARNSAQRHTVTSGA